MSEDLKRLDYFPSQPAGFRKRLNLVLALVGAGGCGMLASVFIFGTLANLLKGRPELAAVCGVIATGLILLASVFVWKYFAYRRPSTCL